jgi:hypothetical protein
LGGILKKLKKEPAGSSFAHLQLFGEVTTSEKIAGLPAG